MTWREGRRLEVKEPLGELAELSQVLRLLLLLGGVALLQLAVDLPGGGDRVGRKAGYFSQHQAELEVGRAFLERVHEGWT